ncbi:MAG: hypothetical protein ACKVOP_12105 [Sphingomonadaceae bacterium]
MGIMTIIRACERHAAGRVALFAIGCLLVAASPIIGALPGPIGLPLFLIGATMMLRTSIWAKRLYVRLKRRWPRQGHWVDRGLRRASAKRRKDRVATD